MNVLAVDWGTKRWGLALGAEGHVVRSQTLTVKNKSQAFEELIKIIETESVGTLVLGLPRRLDGSEKNEAKVVRDFAAQITSRLPIPIVLIDERLTSEEAKSILKEGGLTEKKMRSVIDAQVARILLEQYFHKGSQES